MRLRIGVLAAVAAVGLWASAASAIVVSDDTWEENGGSEGSKTEGYGANEELAQEEPFRGVVDIILSKGSGGTGTWIGRDENGSDYILTAAHVVWNSEGRPEDASNIHIVVADETIYDVEEVNVHPHYQRGFEHDIAVLKVSSEPSELNEENGEPVDLAERAETPPKLFCAGVMGDEEEMLATIVGYGRKGTGSAGSEEDDYQVDKLLAAHNIVDGVTDEDNEEDGRLRNMAVIDFDSESEDTNTLGEEFGSDAKPVDELEGTGASGDSGGPLFVKTEGQGLLLAGVFSISSSEHSEETDGYGAVGYFARVEPNEDWLKRVAPPAEIIGLDGEFCWNESVESGDNDQWKPDWEKHASAQDASDDEADATEDDADSDEADDRSDDSSDE